ncbi:MAG TPA: FixH family protein [Ktedonobacteraceae bacterium]|nr:FixH family protein [Ktedonobacteraceae bacterium]
MRVRWMFWLLLAVSCTGVLVFAALYQPRDPAIMHVQIEQQPPEHGGMTSVQLRLTDLEGVPIENASVASTAWMTNMVMPSPQSKIISLGQGTYIAQLRLDMAGPWEISVTAQADGFTPLKQTLFVQVR